MITQIDSYLRRLFPLCRSITGDQNRETLRVLQEIIPLKIHEVPTGEKVFDWTIPNEWNIRDAWISDESGCRIIDFKANNLHVVNYSAPIDRIMTWAELKPHLHYHPKLTNAIPYRTSYYNLDWGFCVTKEQYIKLEKHESSFNVVIDSELKPGSLSYGEYLIKGRSRKEILLSCYICHPSMANDSLSGVILTAFLAQIISKRQDLYWSYRVVFVPETIGAIAFCAKNETLMKQIDMGLVITTVGGPGKYGYKQSFDSRHAINSLIENVFDESNIDYIRYPFDIHGSDERQYSSQGFRINVATICRDRYYDYPYYHTSLDNLDFVTATQIFETLTLYISLIDKIESRRIYYNKIQNCEVMLSRHNLYPKNGGSQLPTTDSRSELDLILWLLFLCDGKCSIQEIAVQLGVDCEQLTLLADNLVAEGVLVLI